MSIVSGDSNQPKVQQNTLSSDNEVIQLKQQLQQQQQQIEELQGRLAGQQSSNTTTNANANVNVNASVEKTINGEALNTNNNPSTVGNLGNTNAKETVNGNTNAGANGINGNVNNASLQNSSLFGNMTGGYGMGMDFMSGGMDMFVDTNKLHNLSSHLFNLTFSAGALPFNLGQFALGNSVNNMFDSFMSCLCFNRTTSSTTTTKLIEQDPQLNSQVIQQEVSQETPQNNTVTTQETPQGTPESSQKEQVEPESPYVTSGETNSSTTKTKTGVNTKVNFGVEIDAEVKLNSKEKAETKAKAVTDVHKEDLNPSVLDVLVKASPISKKDFAEFLTKNNDEDYSIESSGNKITVIDTKNGKKKEFNFNPQGHLIGINEDVSKYGGTFVYLGYDKNTKTTTAKYTKSGLTSTEVAYREGNKISEKVSKYRSNNWVTTKEINYEKSSVEKYQGEIPEFSVNTSGYKKNGQYATITTSKGVWSQTSDPNQYTFTDKSGKKIWVHAQNKDVLKSVETTEDGKQITKTNTQTVTEYL